MVLVVVLCGLVHLSSVIFKDGEEIEFGHALQNAFILEKGWVHFDMPHGGLMMKKLQESQNELRMKMCMQPGKWENTTGREMMRHSLEDLAAYLGARPADLVFVENTSSGIASVLRSVSFQPTDKILFLDEVHDTFWNSHSTFLSEISLYVIPLGLGWKAASKSDVLKEVDSFLAEYSDDLQHVRLFALSHITSRPAVLLPVKEIVQKVKQACPNAVVLCDGAQAVGQLAKLGIEDSGVDFYVASLSKWFGAPPGAGMLWVHPQHQDTVNPPVSRFTGTFQRRFIFQGLRDQTQMSIIKDLIQLRRNMLGDGGEGRAEEYSRQLIQVGAKAVAEELGTHVFPPPGSGLECSTACVRLPIDNMTRVYETCNAIAEAENMHFTVISIKGQWHVRIAACPLLELSDFRKLGQKLKMAFLHNVCSQDGSGSPRHSQDLHDMVATFSV
jgi:selenocysteine lyase/cysteine desulfurase